MMAALNALQWRIRRRLGPARLLALLMLLVSLAFALWLPMLIAGNEQLHSQVLLATRAGSGTTARHAEPPRIDAREQVGEFVAAFPTVGQNADDLEAVFQCAERQGVRLTRGEYQLRQDAGSPLVTVRASFPIQGEYRRIKGFTAEVLQTLPHVAMEDLRMARSDASTPVLEAVVRFSLVYRRS